MQGGLIQAGYGIAYAAEAKVIHSHNYNCMRSSTGILISVCHRRSILKYSKEYRPKGKACALLKKHFPISFGQEKYG